VVGHFVEPCCSDTISTRDCATVPTTQADPLYQSTTIQPERQKQLNKKFLFSSHFSKWLLSTPSVSGMS
jgi:hypothetical protein